jgi:nucleoside-diphosphate-sugar epimerase
LVTGGSGLIGSHVLVALAESYPSMDVCVATRRPHELPRLSPRHRPIHLDLSKTLTVDEDVDLVVHCAGEIRDWDRMAATNVEGTRRLLDWVVERRVGKFIHFSSVAVYGAGHGCGTLDERSPHRPNNFYAATKKQSEDAVRERCGAHGIEYVILQPTNVISVRPYREDHLLNLMRQIQRGRFRDFSGPGASFNYVAAEAVANSVAAFVAKPLTGRTFILNTPGRLHDVIRWIAEELNVDVQAQPLPRALGAVAGVLFSAAAHVSGRHMPFSYARFKELTTATVFDARAVADEFPHAQAPTLETAIRSLAKRYVREGKLRAFPSQRTTEAV